ncbi:MAG: nicotinamide-nucleotide amidohydrolase family protein [Erysipelotrichaceae bacterium]|nr:nicotinamide-nucleotide amidohydrolase family protein [Erysipelotrichaceae bacterium]
MKELVQLLKQKRITFATCESLTGGLFVERMSEISGVSSVLRGGIVTYATEVKHDVVKIDQLIIDQHGVISDEVAKEMAINTRQLMKADMCVSFTGNAGPDVMEEKPVGEVHTAIALFDKVYVNTWQLSGTRNEIREKIVTLIKNQCMDLLRNLK